MRNYEVDMRNVKLNFSVRNCVQSGLPLLYLIGQMIA